MNEPAHSEAPISFIVPLDGELPSGNRSQPMRFVEVVNAMRAEVPNTETDDDIDTVDRWLVGMDAVMDSGCRSWAWSLVRGGKVTPT